MASKKFSDKDDYHLSILLCNVDHSGPFHDSAAIIAEDFKCSFLFTPEPCRGYIKSKPLYADNREDVAVVSTPHLVGGCSQWKRTDGFVSFVHGNIRYFCCYISPNCSSDEFDNYLLSLERAFKSSKEPLIVAGDFNSRSQAWGDWKDTPRGRKLRDWAISNDLFVQNDPNSANPTFVGARGNSYIDLFFVSSSLVDRVVECSNLAYGTTGGHECVLLRLKSPLQSSTPSNPKPAGGWWIKEENIKKFSYDTKKRVSSVLAHSLLTACTCLEIISNCCNRNFSKKTAFRFSPVPWWNKTTEAKRVDCISIRRRLTRCKDRESRKLIMEQLKTAQKDMKIEIWKAKRASWNDLIDQLEKDPWGKAYKIVTRKRKRPSSQDKSKPSREEILDAFKDLFPVHPPITWSPMPIEEDSVPLFTVEELIQAASRLKKGKSPGPDDIPPEIAKAFILTNKEECLDMFNDYLINGVFPQEWKVAKLVLIPKDQKGSSNKKKFRPICMLSFLGKVFERMLHQRISQEVTLSDSQFGFRKGLSTNDAIERVKTKIKEFRFMNPKKPIAFISLDIKNAFNSISWADLINSLKEKGVSNYLINIMQNYLTDRYVVIEDLTLEVFSGLPQGSILGPLCWNVAYDKVVDLITEPASLKTAFADDLGVIVSGNNTWDLKKVSGEVTKQIGDVLREKDLTLEPVKSEALIFGNLYKISSVLVDDVRIRSSELLKYLGVWLSRENLSFDSHIELACEKVEKIIRSLSCLMPLSKGPSFLKKKLIFTSVLSALLYGLPVWHHDATKIRNIKLIQKTLRPIKLRLCSAYRTVSERCLEAISGFPPIQLTMEERMRRYGKQENFSDIKQDILHQWCDLWLSSPPSEDAWFKRLVPDFEEWILRDNRMETDFFLTQLLSGHGSFRYYLFRFKLVQNPNCVFCSRVVVDDAQHTFFECDRFLRMRLEIEADLNVVFNVGNFQQIIIKNLTNWIRIKRYVKDIINIKTLAFNAMDSS